MNIHTLKTIELTEVNIPNSIAEKKLNKTKAFENLQFAKALHRPVRFAKPGEGEFSRELIEKEKELQAEILTTAQSAKLIGTSVSIIMLKKKYGELPFEKVKGVLYFKREDVLKLNIEKPKSKEVEQVDLTGLLTSKQSAELAEVELGTLRRHVGLGTIKAVFKLRNQFYFKESDILEFKKNYSFKGRNNLSV